MPPDSQAGPRNGLSITVALLSGLAAAVQVYSGQSGDATFAQRCAPSTAQSQYRRATPVPLARTATPPQPACRSA